MESRDVARDYYAGKLEMDPDGEMVIKGKPFDQHIKTEIPLKFENLLACPAGKGGSGLTKGQAKPGAMDVDAATDVNSTPQQRADAARHIASPDGR